MAPNLAVLARLADVLRPGPRRRLVVRLRSTLRASLRAGSGGSSGDRALESGGSARVRAIHARANPVILDRDDRFVFFPNSKVAQRSIARDLLADRAIVRKDDPAGWEARFDRLDDAYLARTVTFTIVRNPYDRVVSAFFYLRDRCGGWAFNRFVVEVLGREGAAFDPHFEPQSDGLFHDGTLLVDCVGRFETLDESWREIAARIGAPPRLPHRGRSRRAASYAEYYDDAARRVVERLYRDDLEKFGYAFGDERRGSRR